MPTPKGFCSEQTALELTVRNHPGVMSHVCGLFSRRAFNVEGILCLPEPGGERSRIWLLVQPDQRLDQLSVQLEKLNDVFAVRRFEPGDQSHGKLCGALEDAAVLSSSRPPL